MKTFRFLWAFSLLFVLVFSGYASDKEVTPKTQIIIKPVGANYLVLKPRKFITKAESRLPIIYIEHHKEKSGALETDVDGAIFSVWYKKDGSNKKIIDLTYYDKESLPTSLSYVVLDTLAVDYSIYSSDILYSSMINAYLLECPQLTKKDAVTLGKKSFFWTKVKVEYISSWLKYDTQNKKMTTFDTKITKDDTRILPLLLTILFFITTFIMAFKEANKKNYWRFVIIISLITTAILTAYLVSNVSLLMGESSPNYLERIFYGLFGGAIFALVFAGVCRIENTKTFTNYKKVYLIFVAALYGSAFFKILTHTYLNGLLAVFIVFLIIFSPVLIIFAKMLLKEKQEKDISKKTKK